MFTSYSICACARACPFAFSCPRSSPRPSPRPGSGPAPPPVGPRARPPRRRNGIEVFPERAARHRWATELGVSVARACGAAPLGNGMGRKCRPGVRRGTFGRRKRAEVFPERAARHHWATELGGSVAQACGAFLVCKLLKKDASLHGSRNALWNVSNRLGWSRRKGMLVYPVLDVVLVSVGGVAGDHLTDESG